MPLQFLDKHETGVERIAHHYIGEYHHDHQTGHPGHSTAYDTVDTINPPAENLEKGHDFSLMAIVISARIVFLFLCCSKKGVLRFID
jgi:hypothetical protein